MVSFDCVIIGGGMVGAASALSLADLGLKVAIVEQYSPQPFKETQPFDLRVSAISLASKSLLAQVNAWQQITNWRFCPYQRLGVWEDELAYTEFCAQDINQESLGYIVENRLIQLSLWQQISQHYNVTLYSPESLISYSQNHREVEIELTKSKLTSRLLIAADGAKSKVRQLAGIGTTGWDYQQSAMLINVKTEQPQQNITWQQFFETGPLAMLPLQGNYASLVWYHQNDEIKRLAALSNEQLTQEICSTFPKKLGKVNVIDKASFQLTRRHANHYQANRVLLLGDAAHTINPMAGQGVNLGFKDVKALQTTIATAIGNGETWHDISVLARYESMRRKDNLMMMTAMDALYAGFSHPSPMVKLARNTGLFFANRVPILKNRALAYACGL